MYSTALAYGGFKGRRREIRAVRKRHVAGGAYIERVQVALWGGELFDEPVNALTCGAVGIVRSHARLVEARHRHDHDGFRDVVEYDHLVVKRERHVRHLAIISRRMGQILEVSDRIVAGIADRAAAEWWQFGEMNRLDGLDVSAKFLQWVVCNRTGA